MAKVILTKEARMADKIIRLLPKQKIIADELGISTQMVSYNMKRVYPEQLQDTIKLLGLAGYEIREREVEE